MRAYGQDLRERIVAFVDEGNLLSDAVETFKVSASSIQRLLRRRDETGEFASKPHGGGNPGRLGPEHLATLRKLCDEHQDAYLRELADLLEGAGGPAVRLSTIYKRLKAMGITRKKKHCGQKSKTAPRCRRSAKHSATRFSPSTHVS